MHIACSELIFNKIESEFNRGIGDSYALKGAALRMLLFHYLFYIENGRYADVSLPIGGLANYIAIACKLCVAVFVSWGFIFG